MKAWWRGLTWDIRWAISWVAAWGCAFFGVIMWGVW